MDHRFHAPDRLALEMRAGHAPLLDLGLIASPIDTTGKIPLMTLRNELA